MSQADLQILSMLGEAVECRSPEERAAYLEQACAGDTERRVRVEALLRAYEAAGNFMQGNRASLPQGGTVDEPLTERPGTVTGPYKLLEQIGEGGFGVVFLAEQTEPVRRKVALKVLKPGMDTRQVVARFEAERQALAIMDHPNIARVFDGGATPSGRPYFVMELVKGVPITEFCDQHHLTPRQRLELFLAVCSAVQHAHQKGIIHRDLKPANVLVARHDTTPIVKVIDFGVAKALGQELTDKTLCTGVAQMVGTPLYMSPEQAGLSGLDLDTRSDIYSLGVLLYELLAGTTPFDQERFKEAGYDEIRRIIREEEPPRPSTRISTLGQAAATVSMQRKSDPKRLSQLFRGELDWIVMKCLEKDRNRRYETANGFAMDVQRYLADEPVLACPPSARYRLRKFARRNRGGLAVAGLVLCLLVLLGSGIGWAVRDRSAREAEAARQQGERQAKVAGQVESIFAEVDRLEREQKWPEALAAARRAEAAVAGGEADAATAQRVRERLKGHEFLDRLEQIRMLRATTGDDGMFNDAGADREYARAFRDYGVDVEELPIEASIDRLKARPALAVPLAAALDDWVDARRRVSEQDTAVWRRLVAVARGIDPEPVRDRLRSTWEQPASETQDELRRLADSIDIRTQHPATLVSLANRLRAEHLDSAVRLLRDAQCVYPGDFWLSFYLGSALSDRKDHDRAIRFCTAAATIRPNSAAAHNILGIALKGKGLLDDAIAAYRKAIELAPKCAYAYSNLGNVLHDQKKLDDAIDAHHKAIELDPKYACAYNNLGNVLRKQKKLDDAIAAYHKAIELDRNYALAYNNLGRALVAQGKHEDAIAAYRKATEVDPKRANAFYDLGNALLHKGLLDEAIAAYHKAIEADRNHAFAYNQLGFTFVTLWKQGKHDKLEDAIAAFRKAIEADPKHMMAHSNLGRSLALQGKFQEAIACYRTAIETDASNLDARVGMARVLATCPDPEFRDPRRAVEHATKAVELQPRSVEALQVLGWALYRAGALRESIEALEESRALDHGGTGDCGQWIVLALAHAKLAAQEALPDKAREHHRAEARRRYEEASKQIDGWRGRPAYDLIGQAIWDFREEARKLMGTTESKK
jgi:serine/threonine protein kinase/tetratricopeptide (TPR) repeat protein